MEKDPNRKEFVLKRYASAEELILESFKSDEYDMTLEELRSSTFGGFDQDENEVEFDFDQHLNGVEQGYWGFIDEDNIIHYWTGRDIPIEELIHFLGHEIGHNIIEQDPDPFKEEMRAESYGIASALAYKFSLEIKG